MNSSNDTPGPGVIISDATSGKPEVGASVEFVLTVLIEVAAPDKYGSVVVAFAPSTVRQEMIHFIFSENFARVRLLC